MPRILTSECATSKASAVSASEFERDLRSGETGSAARANFGRRCSGSCRLYHKRRCCWSETSTLQVGFLFSVLSVHVFFFGGGRGVTPQTLCVASVTLLDGLALVMLAWQAEPRCIDVKHTQNTLQPSQSASTVVVVQTAMLSTRWSKTQLVSLAKTRGRMLPRKEA